MSSSPSLQRGVILRQNSVIKAVGSIVEVMPTTLTSDILLVGDPYLQTERVLDLLGLAWLPGQDTSSLAPGYISIAPGNTLYLRDIVLYNIQSVPSPLTSLPLISDLHDLQTVLGNFTSLLWIFNIDRCGAELPCICSCPSPKEKICRSF